MIHLRTSEKRGIVILILFITAFMLYPLLLTQQQNPFFVVSQAEIPDSLLQERLPKRRNYSTQPLELNSADSVDLIKIRGIGPYYASRILTYRNRLGGFYRIEQLKEITFQNIEIDSFLPLFSVDSTLICKKDLDTMSFRSVLRHPYLEYEDVVLIFNAKRKHNSISYTIMEEKRVLTPQKLRKLKPYFK